VVVSEVSGRYTTTMQGANVYGFEYTAHQSNKTYKFSETVERNASADLSLTKKPHEYLQA
jgi:hypothetical protein